MGGPMVLRLLAAGQEVTVWNRSRDKLAPVLEKGAKAADSPAQVARVSEILMLCNQILVGSPFPVVAEAIRLAEAAGVDANKLPEALKGGFADSLPLQIFGARMAARDFDPPLGTDNIMLKDLNNAAAELYRLPGAQRKGEEDPAVLVEMRDGKFRRMKGTSPCRHARTNSRWAGRSPARPRGLRG